ncbi:hypothetical protein [Dactylosporangium sp. NPDC005555]|uniref:hypothetical protein n=1 Tax=Dactylosporangium sp. NPDC005555 TaxID=3154889 RepID=UPI0033B014D3
MTTHRPLRTTVLVGAIGPKIPPWAGPTRAAPPVRTTGSPTGQARPGGGSPTTSARHRALTTSTGSRALANPARYRAPATSARAGALQAIKWPDALGD